jgi:hypothetical protein
LWDVINVNIGVSILTLVLLSAYFYFTVPKLRGRDIKKFKEVSEELDILPD